MKPSEQGPSRPSEAGISAGTICCQFLTLLCLPLGLFLCLCLFFFFLLFCSFLCCSILLKKIVMMWCWQLIWIDNLTCCQAEIEVADEACYLKQWKCTNNRPNSPNTDLITYLTGLPLEFRLKVWLSPHLNQVSFTLQTPESLGRWGSL